MKRLQQFAAAALVIIPLVANAQSAEGFPSKPVRLIVPFAPGGPTDIAARVIGEKLSARWGQQVVVDNRPGAGGNVGSDIAAKSAPDGYTVVLGVTGSHAINISLMKQMPYHPLKDFEPVTQATLFPNAIAVHPSVPAKTLKELIELAKRQPGKLSYGTDGNGTASHLGMELVKAKSGADMVHVPYKGSAPMLTDLVAGQVPVGITGLPAMQAHAAAGRIRILAVTTGSRAHSNPDIPTVAEQGFPGFAAAPWAGFFVPKGTPRTIVDKLAAEMIAVMQLPEVRERLAGMGSTIVASRPEEFRAFLEIEIQQWAEAVKISGAKVE
jgi:tripartite-type tricarboxylate transporter receptor subunit TctC